MHQRIRITQYLYPRSLIHDYQRISLKIDNEIPHQKMGKT